MFFQNRSYRACSVIPLCVVSLNRVGGIGRKAIKSGKEGQAYAELPIDEAKLQSHLWAQCYQLCDPSADCLREAIAASNPRTHPGDDRCAGEAACFPTLADGGLTTSSERLLTVLFHYKKPLIFFRVP